MVILFGSLTYAGYFAKKKNEATASTVDRITTFLVGIFFGRMWPL